MAEKRWQEGRKERGGATFPEAIRIAQTCAPSTSWLVSLSPTVRLHNSSTACWTPRLLATRRCTSKTSCWLRAVLEARSRATGLEAVARARHAVLRCVQIPSVLHGRPRRAAELSLPRRVRTGSSSQHARRQLHGRVEECASEEEQSTVSAAPNSLQLYTSPELTRRFARLAKKTSRARQPTARSKHPSRRRA